MITYLFPDERYEGCYEDHDNYQPGLAELVTMLKNERSNYDNNDTHQSL